MTIDRDPSDLGIRYAGDPDADPVDLSELLAPDPGPPVPASREAIDAARAELARAQGWEPSAAPPAAACQCGAAGPAWCRRAGRPVLGLVHPSRGSTPAVDPANRQV